MTAEPEERLVAEIPESLKALVDADKRTNKEIVQAALWREFGGQRKGALERRIEEQKRRVSIIESERNERNRELEDAKQELEALEQKREMVENDHQEEKERLYEKVRRVPRDPGHTLVKQIADDLGMTPEDVLTEAYNQ
jgi:septal ring factor EnvC (AmiA/AmiB activator)